MELSYQDVKTQLEELGFDRMEFSYSLTANKDQANKLQSLKINGDEEFDKNDKYAVNSPIEAVYFKYGTKLPFSSKDISKLTYEEAKKRLEAAGFSNISSEAEKTTDEDEIGKLKSIEVNTRTDFEKNEEINPEAPIKLVYYEDGKYEVTMEAEVGGEPGNPVWTITTNLPDDTQISISLWNKDTLDTTPDQYGTVKDGKAEIATLAEGSEPLQPGVYELAASMFVFDQTEELKQLFGEGGKYLAGDLLKTIEVDDDYSEAYIWLEKMYEIKENEINEVTWDTVLQAVNDDLMSVFGGRYTINYTDRLISVVAWTDGSSMVALSAKQGNMEAVSLWHSLSTSMKQYSSKLEKIADKYGYEDTIVAINIVSDLDKSTVFLTAMHGEITKDEIFGIN